MSPNPAWLVSFYREIRVERETEWLHRQTDRLHTQRKHRVRTWLEDGHQQARERDPGRNRACWHLSLGLPASRTVKNQISVVESWSLQYFFFSGSPSRVVEWPWKPRAESAGMSVFRVPGWPREQETYFHPAPRSTDLCLPCMWVILTLGGYWLEK